MSRSCHGAVSTTIVSRSGARSKMSSGGAIGSNTRSRAPSSIAYDETF